MPTNANLPSDATLMAMSQGMLQMSRAYRAAADQMLAELGVSQATAWPIVAIRRLGEGVRQKAVAEELGIEAPSLVRLLDQLEASGLVARKLDADDGRSKTLHLTDAGRRIADDIDQRLLCFRRTVFKDVSTEDADAFLRVLAALRRNTCAAGKAAGKHSGNSK